MKFHSTKCVFLGYCDNKKGFKCLSPQGRIYISRHVVFDHNPFPYLTLFKNQQNSSTNQVSSPFVYLSPNLDSVKTPQNNSDEGIVPSRPVSLSPTDQCNTNDLPSQQNLFATSSSFTQYALPH